MKKWLAKFKFSPRQAVMVGVLVLLGYVAFSTLNVIARNYQLQQRMDELAAENEILELENRQLEYELAYYQTDAFTELEARAKLELQAPGEKVVIFPDRIPEPAGPPQPEPEPTFTQTLADNVREWLYFLFRIET
ncbi:MAG: septum formation initiator family protein [Candidatus Saccharimonadales bacterium]